MVPRVRSPRPTVIDRARFSAATVEHLGISTADQQSSALHSNLGGRPATGGVMVNRGRGPG